MIRNSQLIPLRMNLVSLLIIGGLLFSCKKPKVARMLDNHKYELVSFHVDGVDYTSTIEKLTFQIAKREQSGEMEFETKDDFAIVDGDTIVTLLGQIGKRKGIGQLRFYTENNGHRKEPSGKDLVWNGYVESYINVSEFSSAANVLAKTPFRLSDDFLTLNLGQNFNLKTSIMPQKYVFKILKYEKKD